MPSPAPIRNKWDFLKVSRQSMSHHSIKFVAGGQFLCSGLSLFFVYSTDASPIHRSLKQIFEFRHDDKHVSNGSVPDDSFPPISFRSALQPTAALPLSQTIRWQWQTLTYSKNWEVCWDVTSQVPSGHSMCPSELWPWSVPFAWWSGHAGFPPGTSWPSDKWHGSWLWHHDWGNANFVFQQKTLMAWQNCLNEHIVSLDGIMKKQKKKLLSQFQGQLRVWLIESMKYDKTNKSLHEQLNVTLKRSF